MRVHFHAVGVDLVILFVFQLLVLIVMYLKESRFFAIYGRNYRLAVEGLFLFVQKLNFAFVLI